MHSIRLTVRQLRSKKIINCLIGAYPYGGVNVRDISTVTRIPEPRISELVSDMERNGEVKTYRDGKSRMIVLAKHPVSYLAAA